MNEKTYIFTLQDLYDLLIHYTDGELPLAGVVAEALVNSHLQRMVGLLVESEEWTTPDPLHIRYQGKRTASWAKGEEGMVWETRNDTPNLQ